MSYFSDPRAALEEAEFLAHEDQRTMCVVQVQHNMIVVVGKKEAQDMQHLVLETCRPFEKNHSIYDD